MFFVCIFNKCLDRKPLLLYYVYKTVERSAVDLIAGAGRGANLENPRYIIAPQKH